MNASEKLKRNTINKISQYVDLYIKIRYDDAMVRDVSNEIIVLFELQLQIQLQWDQINLNYNFS